MLWATPPCSSTTASAPSSRSRRAALIPAGPAPTMHTSNAVSPPRVGRGRLGRALYAASAARVPWAIAFLMSGTPVTSLARRVAFDLFALQRQAPARPLEHGALVGHDEGAVRTALLAEAEAAASVRPRHHRDVLLNLDHAVRARVDARVTAEAGGGVDDGQSLSIGGGSGAALEARLAPARPEPAESLSAGGPRVAEQPERARCPQPRERRAGAGPFVDDGHLRRRFARRLPREGAVFEVLLGACPFARGGGTDPQIVVALVPRSVAVARAVSVSITISIGPSRRRLRGRQRDAVLVEADRGLEVTAAGEAAAAREGVARVLLMALRAHPEGDRRNEDRPAGVERDVLHRLLTPRRVPDRRPVLGELHPALRAVDGVAGGAAELALLRELPVGGARRRVRLVAAHARLLCFLFESGGALLLLAVAFLAPELGLDVGRGEGARPPCSPRRRLRDDEGREETGRGAARADVRGEDARDVARRAGRLVRGLGGRGVTGRSRRWLRRDEEGLVHDRRARGRAHGPPR